MPARKTQDLSTRKLQRQFLRNSRRYFRGNGDSYRLETITIAEELRRRGHKIPGRNEA